MGPTTTARLGSITLGEGTPAICVPISHRTVEGLAAAASAVPGEALDLVELRIDYFEHVTDTAALTAALEGVRGALPSGVPLLFTFRTLAEGGQQEIAHDHYERMLRHAIASGLVDAIDVEMFMPAEIVGRVVEAAHAAGVTVVMSSHDFDRTPPREEIIARLYRQQELGADIVKIAVMPRSPRDVITLLDATEAFSADPATVPAITMSMGPLGVVSRLSGEAFGSCLTFGAAEAASAPGQMDVGALRGVLDAVHDAMASPRP